MNPNSTKQHIFKLIDRALKIVMNAGRTEQNPTKKRRLCVIDEHLKAGFTAVLPNTMVFKHPAKQRHPQRNNRLATAGPDKIATGEIQ